MYTCILEIDYTSFTQTLQFTAARGGSKSLALLALDLV